MSEIDEIKAKAQFEEDIFNSALESSDRILEKLDDPHVCLLWSISVKKERRYRLLKAMLQCYEKTSQFEKCAKVKNYIDKYL